MDIEVLYFNIEVSAISKLCLLGCRGKRLRGIYTSSCKKAGINVSHHVSMSVAPGPPDQPHSPPEPLSSNSMLADGHVVSSNVLVNEGLRTPSHLSFSAPNPSRIGLQQVGTIALLIMSPRRAPPDLRVRSYHPYAVLARLRGSGGFHLRSH
jgi:hypothetical protein